MTDQTYDELLDDLGTYNERTKIATAEYEANLATIISAVDTTSSNATDAETARDEAVTAKDEAVVAAGFIIKVSAYGADRTGLTDSTDALNDAFEALRQANIQPVAGLLGSINNTLDFEGGLYSCSGSLNVTGLTTHGWTINGHGAVIISSADSKAAFDLTTSRWGTISQLTITAADEDNVLMGVQYGRDETLATANSLVFDNVTVTGYYTRTPVYNYASEVDTHIAPTYINYKDTPDSYALILDGDHEWGIVSDFVTAAPLHTHKSNIQHTFIGGSVRKLISGPTVWITQTKQLQFVNSYLTCIDDHAVVIADSGTSFTDLDFDIHFEANGMLSCFKFDRTTNADSIALTETSIPGFKFTDHGPQASNRVFYTDTDLDIRLMGEVDIHYYQQVPANGLFQPRPQFKFIGDMKLPNLDSNSSVKTYGTLTSYGDTLTGTVGGSPEIITDIEGHERIFKGKVIFTSKEDDNINLANIDLFQNVTIEDGVITLTELTSETDNAVSGSVVVDSGNNWSGVNDTGSPMPVFLSDSTWLPITKEGSISFGDGVANRIIMKGEAVSETTARFYVPIDGSTSMSIELTGAFSIYERGTSVSADLTAIALSALSSSKMAVIDVTTTGLVVGDNYNLRTSGTDSLLKITY